jgi:hypothetical protein
MRRLPGMRSLGITRWTRPGMVLRRVVVMAVGGLALVASTCGETSLAVAADAMNDAASVPSNTVWLCRPGQANDPCTTPLGATTVTSNGATTALPAKPNPAPRFDCFYVYPTVSNELTDNANLRVQPAETGVAVDQAARFSQVCRVWAPMYRQRTELSLTTKALGGDPKGAKTAYDSLLSGWKDYLAHYNDGRPIIFIGHSQGAAILIQLLRSQVDPNPTLRARMVSAIILGGNVQVPTGKDVGGSFQHIPTCSSVAQTECVIAYSTFSSQPPSGALFSRPGQGVSLQSGQTAKVGQQVACVNPINFSSATGTLVPYFLRVTSPVPGVKVTTPWETFPGLYTAACESKDGASWLQINAAAVPGDPRPKVKDTLGPEWGLHLDDVNLALGNLVLDVAFEEAAFH